MINCSSDLKKSQILGIQLQILKVFLNHYSNFFSQLVNTILVTKYHFSSYYFIHRNQINYNRNSFAPCEFGKSCKKKYILFIPPLRFILQKKSCLQYQSRCCCSPVSCVVLKLSLFVTYFFPIFPACLVYIGCLHEI